MRERRDQHARTELIGRVRGEFSDMPGLRLTLRQASRLWSHSPEVCKRIFQELEHQGVLKRANGDAYCRRDLGG